MKFELPLLCLLTFLLLFSCVSMEPELGFEVQAIHTDQDNNIYLAASGHAIVPKFLHSSQTDWWIKKYDSELNEIKWGWNKKIDRRSSQDYPSDILINSSNEILIGGTGGARGRAYDWWILKWNTRGRRIRQWDMVWDGTGSYANVYAMVQNNQGDIYAGGDLLYAIDEDSGFDGVVNKFDHNGKIISDFSPLIYNKGGSDSVTALAVDSEWLYVAGDSDFMVEESLVYEGWLRKYESDGATLSELWNVTIDFDDYNKIRDILILPDRSVFVVGWSFIRHYTEDGELIAGNWRDRYKDNIILHACLVDGEVIVIFNEFIDYKRSTIVDRMALSGNPIDGGEHFFSIEDSDLSLATVDLDGNYIFASGSVISKYDSEGQLLELKSIF
ncbi:MAG: hypothetical protein JEY99_04270 [Spirochaetales bacterium]|nr:hypothetical protein [Spirochaetales bacterium]